jgi:diguanylate cyclase (GGDEF)-like protein
VVLLPATDREQALTIAENIRRAVADLAVAHEDNEGGIVTVSIGVATTPPQADDGSAALVEAADAAVYEAKASGRNRVSAASGVRTAAA